MISNSESKVKEYHRFKSLKGDPQMKKLICALICIPLLLSSSLADGKFDMSAIRNNEYLEIDVDNEKEVGYVESTLSSHERSFTHSKEATNLYSTTQMDFLIIDYFSSKAYPVWRLWMSVATDDKFYHITSVTFTIDGKDYTFSNVADKDWFFERDNGYIQQLLIKFGVENSEFILAVLKVLESAPDFDTAFATRIPVVFHGTEDITAELGDGFIGEFMIFLHVLSESNGIEFMNKVHDTPLKVSNAV